MTTRNVPSRPPVTNNCCSQGCFADDIYDDQPCYGDVVVIDEEWGDWGHDFIHACRGHRGGYGTYVEWVPCRPVVPECAACVTAAEAPEAQLASWCACREHRAELKARRVAERKAKA